MARMLAVVISVFVALAAVAPAFAAGRIVIGGGEGSLFVIKEGDPQ